MYPAHLLLNHRDQCRGIFGGRSTYTLYTVDATLAILTRMEASRQKGVFRASALQQLIDLARYYLAEHKLSTLAAEASAQHKALMEEAEASGTESKDTSPTNMCTTQYEAIEEAEVPC